MRKLQLTGQPFGRLRVTEFADAKNGASRWSCECWCGNHVVVRGADLTSGNTKSCGCLMREIAVKNGKASATHGQSRKGQVTAEYTTWRSMIKRCTDPRHKSFERYGGRGIKVCKRWRTSFQNFFADMGKRPSASHSIHRVRGGKGYCPSNCVWATWLEQNRHKSDVKLTQAKAEEIRSRYAAGGITQEELAAEYGTTRPNISFVVVGKSWNNLPPKKPSASVTNAREKKQEVS
jgi:hypothetical protein